MDGDKVVEKEEGKGSPQGGVISPLLANLLMHYAFITRAQEAWLSPAIKKSDLDDGLSCSQAFRDVKNRPSRSIYNFLFCNRAE